MQSRILLVDDDHLMGETLDLGLQGRDWELEQVFCGEELDAAFERFSPDVILLDLLLEESDGIEVLHQLKERTERPPIVLISGIADRRTLRSVQQYGKGLDLPVAGFLQKPFTVDDLERCVNPLLRQSRPISAGELDRAIDGNELELFLQPKVLARSRALLGAEALVRWRHPQRGLIMPDRFIALAEHTGRIRRLTDWVGRAAFGEIETLLRGGLDLGVSFNVSAHDLADETFVSRFHTWSEGLEVPKDRITLEVTETQAIQRLERALSSLSRVRLSGAHLAIDDFGTGHSSLEMLKRLPYDELKIDRHFVVDLEHDESAKVIVQGTIEIAKALGLFITAEGVENLQTWKILEDLGSDAIQGYVVSRPLPAAEFRTAAARGFERQKPGLEKQ